MGLVWGDRGRSRGKTTTAMVWKAKYFNGVMEFIQLHEIRPFCSCRMGCIALTSTRPKLSTEIMVLCRVLIFNF